MTLANKWVGNIALAKKKKDIHGQPISPFVDETCDLGGIQTRDLQNRNLTLYSAKLRGQYLYFGRKDTAFL